MDILINSKFKKQKAYIERQVSSWLGLGEVGGTEVNSIFWGDENVLKLIAVMVAQLCEYTPKTELHILNE